MRINRQLSGYSMMLLYCIVMAGAFHLAHSTSRIMSPYLVTFWTFLITTIVYSVLCRGRLKSTIRTAWHFKKSTLLINILSAGNWTLGFVALSKIPAWLYGVLAIGLQPILTFTIDKLIRHTKPHGSLSVQIPCLILITTLIVWVCVAETLKTSIPVDALVIGYAAALLSSTMGALYLITSENYHRQTGFNASQVIAVAFYLTIILCAVVSSSLHVWQANYSLGNVIQLLGLVICSAILPVFLTQASILRIGAVSVSFFRPIVLLMTYAIGLAIGASYWHSQTFYYLLTITILLFVLLKLRYSANSGGKTS